MRVFISIQFNEAVKDYLHDIQHEVKLVALKGSFTLYDNFHLTLKFIGEADNEDIDNISDVLDEVANEFSQFPIKIGGINSFKRANKQLVYVEVLENHEKLKQLAKIIDTKLKDLDFKLEPFNFKPHITIGREVVFSQVTVLNVLKNYVHPVMINEIALMLSTRDKNNVLKYTPLYTVNLQ